MDDLAQWLRAQLDEEQQEAEDALRRTTTTRRWIGGQWVEDTVQPPEWRRSVWDPARVLREIDAKRKLIARYERAMENRRAHRDDLASAGALLALHGAVKLIAAPYADRPGYEEALASFA